MAWHGMYSQLLPWDVFCNLILYLYLKDASQKVENVYVILSRTIVPIVVVMMVEVIPSCTTGDVVITFGNCMQIIYHLFKYRLIQLWKR
jgi:hypothetical protein